MFLRLLGEQPDLVKILAMELVPLKTVRGERIVPHPDHGLFTEHLFQTGLGTAQFFEDGRHFVVRHDLASGEWELAALVGR